MINTKFNSVWFKLSFYILEFDEILRFDEIGMIPSELTQNQKRSLIQNINKAINYRVQGKIKQPS